MATSAKPTKKSPAKKPAAKKTTAKRTAKATPTVRSFRVSAPTAPFLTFSVTKQTLYWIVLAFILVGFGLWIYRLDSEVQRLYDQLDASYQQTLDAS